MTSDAVVDKLYRCLVDAVREQRPDAGARPVTVAEIYQDLVPYRSVRDALGVGLNADYEHAVLRLLAGVGGHAHIEPPEVCEELRRELDSPNPNVALFREFAACDVRIRLPDPTPRDAGAAVSPSATDGRDGAQPSASGAGEPATEAGGAPRLDPPLRDGAAPPSDELEPERRVVGRRGTARAVPHPDAAPPTALGGPADPPGSDAAGRADSTRAPSTDHSARGERCAFCDEALPTGRSVRYCPYCGADRRRRPCSACGEVLEPDWRYCVACGTAAPEPAADPD
ncbi:MAG: double zinc ribbon domain-containing protein [Gemmatimonadota bacterium]